jgi:tetratricopeptide (TPR) repeat protein
MFRKLTAPSLGLLALFIASAVSGQTPAAPAGQPTAPNLRKLSGDDAKHAEELGKFTQAQALFEKGLEIRRRLLTDDHSLVAESYENAAMNLAALGEYVRAEPLLEKSLEIYRRRLTDGHLKTTIVTNKLASDLAAQGKYTEAQDRWLGAARSMDKARLRFVLSCRRGPWRASRSRHCSPQTTTEL